MNSKNEFYQIGFIDESIIKTVNIVCESPERAIDILRHRYIDEIIDIVSLESFGKIDIIDL